MRSRGRKALSPRQGKQKCHGETAMANPLLPRVIPKKGRTSSRGGSIVPFQLRDDPLFPSHGAQLLSRNPRIFIQSTSPILPQDGEEVNPHSASRKGKTSPRFSRTKYVFYHFEEAFTTHRWYSAPPATVERIRPSPRSRKIHRVPTVSPMAPAAGLAAIISRL